MRGVTTLLVLLVAQSLDASTVRLPCIADISESPEFRVSELGLRPAALLNFRLEAVRSWHIDKASLMVHLAGGDAPDQLDVAVVPDKWSEKKPASRRRYAFLIHSVHPEPDGWLSVPLRQTIVDDLLSGKVWGLAISGAPSTRLHSRESITFAPYLLVEGHGPSSPHTDTTKTVPPPGAPKPEVPGPSTLKPPAPSPNLPPQPVQKLRK